MVLVREAYTSVMERHTSGTSKEYEEANIDIVDACWLSLNCPS